MIYKYVQITKSPTKLFGLEETLSQVEARYPAIMFKQQLTASLEKIFGHLRESLKKEILPLLNLCIQVFIVSSGLYCVYIVDLSGLSMDT